MFANEIYRVLKPGGICCVGATNRYYAMLADGLPEKLGRTYLKVLWKGESSLGKPPSYLELKRLFKMFDMDDKTPDLLKSPREYNVEGEIPKQLRWLFRILPYSIVKLLIPLCVSWVILFRKPVSLISKS
jgi:ubiquinone/menaquinone biosynthesis C-methylase UbiE